jgi:hypothetical protein
MAYTKNDLFNCITRSDLKGEYLKMITAMGETAQDGSWRGGFILARENGTYAVLEGWTGPAGWVQNATCGYDLRITKNLDDAWALMNDDYVFEVLAPEKCAPAPEMDTELETIDEGKEPAPILVTEPKPLAEPAPAPVKK